MTTAQALMEARAIRRTVAEIGVNVADMTRTLVRMGDASDWQDPALERLEMVIGYYERERLRLIAQARQLEAGSAA